MLEHHYCDANFVKKVDYGDVDVGDVDGDDSDHDHFHENYYDDDYYNGNRGYYGDDSQGYLDRSTQDTGPYSHGESFHH